MFSAMDIELIQLVIWGFQALILGAFGLLIYEMRDLKNQIRKLRERDIDMEKRLAHLETKIAENYVTRSELNQQIATAIATLDRSIKALQEHLNDKFAWLARAIKAA